MKNKLNDIEYYTVDNLDSRYDLVKTYEFGTNMDLDTVTMSDFYKNENGDICFEKLLLKASTYFDKDTGYYMTDTDTVTSEEVVFLTKLQLATEIMEYVSSNLEEEFNAEELAQIKEVKSYLNTVSDKN